MDDRPHNSIPLDEMTDGRAKPPSTLTGTPSKQL